jgi:hypothetical protein
MARQGDNYYLVITDTVQEDSGIYMASATNTDGEAKSYGRLTVNQQVSSSDVDSTVKSINVETTSVTGSSSKSGQPPSFKKLFYDQYAKLGDNLRLEAIILGSPKPKV